MVDNIVSGFIGSTVIEIDRNLSYRLPEAINTRPSLLVVIQSEIRVPFSSITTVYWAEIEQPTKVVCTSWSEFQNQSDRHTLDLPCK